MSPDTHLRMEGLRDFVFRFRKIFALFSLGFWHGEEAGKIRSSVARWQDHVTWELDLRGPWIGIYMKALVESSVRTCLLPSVQARANVQLVEGLCNSQGHMVQMKVHRRRLATDRDYDCG